MPVLAELTVGWMCLLNVLSISPGINTAERRGPLQLLRFLGPKRWGLISAFIVCGFISGFSYALLIVLVDKSIAQQLTWHSVWVSFLCASAVYTAARYGGTRTIIHLSQSALSHMRVELCRSILESPQELLHATGKPRLLATLTTDIETLSAGYRAMIAAVLNAVILLCGMIYLAQLYLPFALALTTCLVIGGFLQLRGGRWPMSRLESARQILDHLYKALSDLLGGTRELQLNNQRAAFYIDKIVEPRSIEFSETVIDGMGRFALVLSMGELMFCGALLLIIAPRIGFHAPAEVVRSAITIVLFLSPAISELLRALPDFSKANVSLAHIQTLLGALSPAPAAQHLPQQTPLQAEKFRQLEVRGVSHVYGSPQDHNFQVGPIDLIVKQGEIVFIAGGNGSGKSTLSMLLLGLIPPHTGSLHLNGIEIGAQTLEAYRQNFSAIFSDYQLFDTLFETTAQDLSRASDYLCKLRLEGKVSIQAGRFSTVALSSGQRKRLALVLAYMEDRPVYLFDEWASDQDPEFRLFFYTELLTHLKAIGKTVIAITHDDQYFHCADRIIRMRDGQIVSQSASQDLGQYSEIEALGA